VHCSFRTCMYTVMYYTNLYYAVYFTLTLYYSSYLCISLYLTHFTTVVNYSLTLHYTIFYIYPNNIPFKFCLIFITLCLHTIFENVLKTVYCVTYCVICGELFIVNSWNWNGNDYCSFKEFIIHRNYIYIHNKLNVHCVYI